MVRLEMCYQMQVVLYLPRLLDVFIFSQVNHTASVAVSSLQVNPWFTNYQDIEKFYRIYSPPTINCNFLQITIETMKKAVYIRNCLMTSKMLETMTPDFFDKFPAFFIEKEYEDVLAALRDKYFDNAVYFLSLFPKKRVSFSIKSFVEIIKKWKSHQYDKTHFPKTIYLRFKWFFLVSDILSPTDTVTSDDLNVIESAAKEFSCQIIIDWSSARKNMLSNVINMKSCEHYSHTYTTDFIEYFKPLLKDGEITFIPFKTDEVQDLHISQIEQTVGLCAPKHIKFMSEKVVLDLTNLNLPECVECFEILPEDTMHSHQMPPFQCILPKMMKYNEFKAKKAHIKFGGVLDSIKKVVLEQNISFENIQTDENNEKILFPFINVEELRVMSTRFVAPKLDNLKRLTINYSNGLNLYINKECAKNIELKYLRNAHITIDAEIQKEYSFENCYESQFTFLNAQSNTLKINLILCEKNSIVSKCDAFELISLEKCKDVNLVENVENTNDIFHVKKVVLFKSKFVNDLSLCAETVVLKLLNDELSTTFNDVKDLILISVNNCDLSKNVIKLDTLNLSLCDNLKFTFNNSTLKKVTISTSENVVFFGNFRISEKVIITENSKVEFPSKITKIEKVNFRDEVEKFDFPKIAPTNRNDYFREKNKEIVLHKNNTTINNGVFPIMKISSKIEVVFYFKISNFFGHQIDYSGVLFDTFVFENCEFENEEDGVDSIFESYVYRPYDDLYARQVEIINTLYFWVNAMSITKYVKIRESKGIIFMHQVNVKKVEIVNSEITTKATEDSTVSVCKIDNGMIRNNGLLEVCSNMLYAKNLTLIYNEWQCYAINKIIQLKAMEVHLEDSECVHISLTKNKEAKVVLKNCQKVDVVINNSANVQTEQCDEIEIFDSQSKLIQKLPGFKFDNQN
ncbi:hypothetical protein EIN_360750 [Entamoeba invadens IP1]|uniref:C-CAP/cofactor C-like domain-containing protein n=1 Tax=Entamoeba invadens IP1 TaxID=370355 RepID=A0A0A1U7S2_ENTIV|nr:hypothetical protein EIN_360750 [Entamoeba invadens IP1]ELP90912.1 hypothetical protein EIN_360750 [Entamoeba invadens IP1]|eukprot:XP_004257683.1 hypothetical protein EIN_360750 [Entamoeba invadens IP1]